MTTRLDVLDDDRTTPRTNITLRSGPNWTAVLFFAALGLLHLYMAATAFLHHRYEGFMSLIFGVGFCAISLIARFIHTEITLLASERRLRHRVGCRVLARERSISFSQVKSIRLTLLQPRNPLSARLELVCDREVIECPPTTVPREEALCLAITMGVELVKVYSPDFPAAAERL